MNKPYNVTLPILLLFVSIFTNPISAQNDNGKELIAGEKIDKTISVLDNHTYTVELDNEMAIVGEEYRPCN